MEPGDTPQTSSPGSSEASGSTWQNSRAVLVLVIAVAYLPSFWGQMYFDDLPSIHHNKSIRQLWPLTKPLYEAEGATTAGRPLLNLSLAFNYAISGTNPWSYHVFNLVVHLGVALLLAEVITRTFLLPGFSEFLRQRALWIGAAVGLVWGVHPIGTNAVTYIVQRAEAMMAFFYLGTLYCVLRDEQLIQQGRELSPRRKGWQGLAFGLCWLGMATKEVMASSPLILPLYDRVYLSRSWSEVWSKRGPLYLGFCFGWVLLGALLVSSSGRQGTAGLGFGTSAISYAKTQFGVILEYFRLSFWPVGLALDWGFGLVRFPSEWVPQAVAVLLLFGLAVVFFAKNPRWGFWAFWVFVLLGPTSTIIPLVTQTAAEHRMYMPLMGFVTLTIAGATALMGRFSARAMTSGSESQVSKDEAGSPSSGRRGDMLLAGSLALLAGTLTVLTFQQNQLFSSGLALWSHCMQYRPENPRVYAAVGNYLIEARRFDEAIATITRGIEIDPDGTRTGWYNRANDVTLSHLYHNRGVAHARKTAYTSAIADYTRALAIRDDHVLTLMSRASALMSLNQFDAAWTDIHLVENLDPDLNPLYSLRGMAYLKTGDLQRAQDEAWAALDAGAPLEEDFKKALVETLKKDSPKAAPADTSSAPAVPE